MEQKKPGFIRTRLAPTPSGLLHPGNGLSFLTTWCLARAAGSAVFLRIDDLDKDRRRRVFLEDTFRTLDWLGIDYDEGPAGVEDFLQHYSQHHRLDLYREALEQLRRAGALYACTCSRRQIQERSDTGLYPQTCRDKGLAFEAPGAAWRVRLPENLEVSFREWGRSRPVSIRLADFMGDFVVRQKNKMPAYQIASLVDDLHYQVDFIVRGEDLKISTAAQTHLADLLGANAFRAVTFFHHPLLTGEDGAKLSKSKGAGSLQAWREAGRSPRELLPVVRRWLGLPPAADADLTSLVAACRERFF